MALVAVYDKHTGRKHSVPEHWMDNPVLSKNLRKAPKQAASESTPPTAPSGDDKKENTDARPR